MPGAPGWSFEAFGTPRSLISRPLCSWLGSATHAAKPSLSREQQAVGCGSPRHAYREVQATEEIRPGIGEGNGGLRFSSRF
jgi:hypothetical protein